MTAPTPEHLSPWMEKAREVLLHACRGADRVALAEYLAAPIARALAAEHDAALEKAAVECDERGILNESVEGPDANAAFHRMLECGEIAAAIRAMRGASDE